MAEEWTDLQARFVESAASLRRHEAPSTGDIAMLLQTIVGAWPLDLDVADRAGRQAFAERLVAWQQKALREAKLATDWAAPDEAYEDAARALALALVAEGALPGLLEEIVALVNRIAPAGAVGGLAQTLLRLTVPGIPDLYQGCDLWDFSLVDPDNRRPVDWKRRLEGPSSEALLDLAATWRDGRIKQALIARLLDVRRRLPLLFSEGGYRSLRLSGHHAQAVVAFERHHAQGRLIVVAPRLPARLPLQADSLTLGAGGWRETALVYPEGMEGRWSDALGGATRHIAGPALSEMCGSQPFAVLVR